jgi:Ca-activated chloride channel family protein
VVTAVRCKKPEGDARLELPLQHTDVRIQVSGFVARATVTQAFANPYAEPIEAVYVFPLPDDAAVDAMTMHVGERVVRAKIERRDVARKLYEQARDRGQRAALLEEERANIFTQSVANIMPGDEIRIEIQYVQILRYEEGAYEVVFPMVVGPRYIPGEPTGASGTGWAPDTDRVPDASRITPKVLRPKERSGHDIALAVTLDAGVPIRGLYSESHALSVWEEGPSRATIELSPADRLPNKDFILRYEVAGAAPQVALIPHYDDRGGFFTLIVQPERDMDATEITPREIILIADTSGSMQGFPMEKSKQAMRKLLGGMRRTDRFNIVRFAGDTATLFAAPEPYTAERLEQALAFVDAMRGSGGTEMAAGIVEALSQPSAPGTLRVAILLTDGYVDEAEVFDSIQYGRRAARVFALGIGSSPNRYLLDRAAMLGRGEAFFLRSDGDAAFTIGKLFRRIDRPALRNIQVDWGDLDVTELYPAPLPDLFAGQPLYLFGRYQQGGDADIVIEGELARGRFTQSVAVSLPASPTADSSMASVWARQKIKTLMLDRVRLPGQSQRLTEEIATLGLDFNLMTQWTSFIAVQDEIANPTGQVCTVDQPVALPDGVSYEGVFGEETGCAGTLGMLGTSGFGGIATVSGGEGYGVGYGIGYGGLGMASLGGRGTRNLISFSTPVVMGSLSKETIQRVIDRFKSQIRYCYELALLAQPDLAGKVAVKIIINEHGDVTSVTVTESTLGNAKVEACILRVMARAKFPAPAAGGSLEVNYPFVFQVAGE